MISWITCTYCFLSETQVIHASHALSESNRRTEVNTPLIGICEGDCDGDDSLCQMGLSCFSRSRWQPVPGCEDESSQGTRGEDFCYEAPPGVLVHVRDNSGGGGVTPASARPLSACEGDCDADDDCDGELTCFPRIDNEKVPGCRGSGKSGINYCHDPTLEVEETAPSLTLKDPVPTARASLGLCEGNCTGDDSLCEHGLSCFARRRKELVPGCSSRGWKGADYCYAPPQGVLVYVGDNVGGVDAESDEQFPLDVCQGNCNGDADCRGTLKCSIRTPSIAVPGCDGTGISGIGYCYELVAAAPPPPTPALSQPTPASSPAPTAPVPTVQPTQFSATPEPPYGNCEGGCIGDDGLCQFGLSCFIRDSDEPVPGCPTINGKRGTDFCYKPPEGVLVYKSEDDDPGVFPLANCEGDCDDDWDCGAGLLCYIREEFEPVPGCSGNGAFGRDYCYKPNNYTQELKPQNTQKPTATGGGSGDSDGLSNGAVIAIIVVTVVTANICLCICCKWLLSRDPTDVRGKDTSEIAPQLDAEGGVLLGVNTGSSPGDNNEMDAECSHLDVGAAEYDPVDNTNEIT